MALLESLVPQLFETAIRRVHLLSLVATYAPIGRRNLSEKLNMSERSLRTELSQLKELDLISIDHLGIRLTETGLVLVEKASYLLTETAHLKAKEARLQAYFKNSLCRIVPGNLDEEPAVLIGLGRTVSEVLEEYLPQGDNILAVSGGSTVAGLVTHISEDLCQGRQFTVLPARGGSVGKFSIQANTVSHLLATKLKAKTQGLFVPDQLSEMLQDALLKDPSVSEIVGLLKKSNCLIYSVGDATIMAARRGASKRETDRIFSQQAIGESMGVFFDKEGRIVHQLARIGLHLEDLKHIGCGILVAGGEKKAAALAAYMKFAPQQTIVVVDEALANLVLKEETL